MTTTELNNIGERLRLIRERCGLKRKEVEELTSGKIKAASLSSYENNQSQISLKYLSELVVFYKQKRINISYDWLITGKGIPPSEGSDLTSNITAAKECAYFLQVNKMSKIITATTEKNFPYIRVGDFLGVIERQQFDRILKLYQVKYLTENTDIILAKHDNGCDVFYKPEDNSIGKINRENMTEINEIIWIRKQH